MAKFTLSNGKIVTLSNDLSIEEATDTIDAIEQSITPEIENKSDDYSVSDFAKDSAIKLGQGAIELGQQVVGGADLATGGIFGIREGLEKSVGYQPEKAKQILGNELSDTQQRQDAALSQAHGLDKFGAAAENPLAVTGAIEQSIPSMLAGMGLTKAVATKIFTEAATAAGGLETAEGIAAGKQAVQEAATKLIGVSSGAEGAITAGGIAEEADRNGKDWSEYAPEALGAGAVTGAIGFGSGKLFGDVATDLAAGTKTMNGGFLAKVGKGAFTEGLMEEAPQSASETAFTNSIYDRPIGEGVADAAIEGGIIGGVMGAAMGGGENFTQRNQPDGTSPLGEQILKDEAPVDSATMSSSNNDGISDNLGDLNARVQSILNPASAQNPIQQIAQTDTIDEAIGAFNNSVVIPQLDAPVVPETPATNPVVNDETAIEQPPAQTKYPTKLDDSQESIALLDQFLSNGAILKGRFLIHDNKQVTALTKTQKDLAEELLKNENDIKPDVLPITEQPLDTTISDRIPTGETQTETEITNEKNNAPVDMEGGAKRVLGRNETRETASATITPVDSKTASDNQTATSVENAVEPQTAETLPENPQLAEQNVTSTRKQILESTDTQSTQPVSYDNLEGLLKRPSDNAPFKDEKSANTRFKLQKLSDEDYAVVPVKDGYAIAPIKAMDYEQFKALPDNAPFSDDVIKQSFEALTGKVAPSTISEKVVENSAEKLALSFPVDQKNNEMDLIDNSTPIEAHKSLESTGHNLSSVETSQSQFVTDLENSAPNLPKDLSKINDISLPENWKTDLPQAKWLAGRILRELEGKTGTDRQNAVESITDVNKISPFIEQVLSDANAQKIVKPESPYHPAIANYASQLVKNGGVEILPDGSRTPSVNPDWFRSGKGKNVGKTFKAYKTVDKTGKVVDFYSSSVSVEEVKKAVSAHDAGQKLTARQHGILLALSDVAQAEEDFYNRNDVDFDDAEISALSSLLHEIEAGEASIFASMSESDFDKMLDNLDTKPKTERENMLALGFTEKEIEQELKNGDDTRGNRNTQGNVTREEKGSDQNVAGAKNEGAIESSPLSQYTNDEILAREKELAELDKQEKERDLKAKQKAEADRQIDSLADEMLGKGGTATRSIFDMVEPPKRKSAFDDNASIADKGREVSTSAKQTSNEIEQPKLKSDEFAKHLAELARGKDIGFSSNQDGSYDLTIDKKNVITVDQKPRSFDDAASKMLEKYKSLLDSEGKTLPSNPYDMTRDQFLIANKFGNLIEDFEISGADIQNQTGGLKHNADGTFGIDHDALYDRIQAQKYEKPAIAKQSETVSPEKAALQKILKEQARELAEALLTNHALKAIHEEKIKIVPLMSNIMETAFKLGYLTFKENARFVLNSINEISKEAGALITIHNLRAGYINFSQSGEVEGTSSFSEVGEIKTIDEILNSDNASIENEDLGEINVPSANTDLERHSTDTNAIDPRDATPIFDESTTDARIFGQSSEPAKSTENVANSDKLDSISIALTGGEQGDNELSVGNKTNGIMPSDARDSDSGRSSSDSIEQMDVRRDGNFHSIHAEKNTPQRIHVSSQIKNLLSDFENGRITNEQLTRELSKLHNELESKNNAHVRGAASIRKELHKAKQRGDISDDAADLAEWFILQNEALVDDLGISLKSSNQSESKGSAGYYNPISRILTLIKGSAKDTTAVHEMLHHLERLMPEDLQAGIRNEWLKQTLAQYKKATDLHADYFEAALSGNQQRALKILSKIGDKNQKLYRFINASEFWAVNSTDILQNRFHAKSSAIGRVKQWLREFIQHVKKTFGFASHSPLLNTLDYLLNQSNGDKQTNSMLSQRNGHLFADKIDFEDTKGKPTQDDYLKNRVYTRNYKARISSVLKGFGNEISDGIDNYLGSSRTRLENISKVLSGALVKLEYDINSHQAADIKAVLPFLEKMKTMAKTDYADMDYALKNGDTAKINLLIGQYNLHNEYAALRETLDKLRDEANDVGLSIGKIESYFPRVMNDTQGFLNAIGKGDKFAIFTRKINEEARKQDLKPSELSKSMKADLIANMIEFQNTGLAGLRSSKSRKLEKIPPELNEFYMDSPAALLSHIHSMRKHIEYRKMLGHVPKKVAEIKSLLHKTQVGIEQFNNKMDEALNDEQKEEARKSRNELFGISKQLEAYLEKYVMQRDYTQNIHTYIMQLVVDKQIPLDKEQEVFEILTARLHEHGTTGLVNAYQNFSYIDTMGSFSSAITQLGDYIWVLYEGGLLGGAKNIGKAISKKGALSNADFGIERIGQEFADSSTLADAVNTVFKYTGLNKITGIASDAVLSTVLEKFQKQAKSQSDTLRTEITPMFGKETDSVLQDLRDGTINDNVKMLVYSRYLDFYPASLSELPVKYLTAGNGRVFYTLKRFQIKFFDIVRREVFNEIRDGNTKTGLKNLALIMMLFVAAGMGTDQLKDWLHGRNTDWDDLITDNLLKLMGVSKFITYQARTEGVGTAALKQILPPFSFINALGKDIIKADDINTHPKNEMWWQGLETLNSVPLVGKLTYWHMGRGQHKREELYEIRFKKEKQRLNEIKDELEQLDGEDYRRFYNKHFRELNRLKLVNKIQGQLSANKRQINFHSALKKSANREYSINKLNEQREKIMTEFLKG